MVRDADGEYTLHVKPVEVTPTGDREADVDAIVLRFTQMLEDMVRDYPGQYFWQHRRWRRQPPDTPPHLREP
jgi:Kdo2-lipid IVA lauroyltransferase/acyltransferase